ncbi:unnamed protein product [Prunus armeniaca]
MSQASTSLAQSPQRRVHTRLHPQEDQPHDHPYEVREERRPPARSQGANSRRQAIEVASQAQSTNTPRMQDSRGDMLHRDNEEVNQRFPNHGGHRSEPQSMRAEDVEKLVNDRLRDLKMRGDFEDALRKEVNQLNSSPFTTEIEQATPPKRFSTPSSTHFKGDFDP